MTTPDVRLARLEERVADLTHDVDALTREGERTRGRLHGLEQYKAAEKAATAARDALLAAQRAQTSDQDRRFTVRLAVTNVVVVAGGVVAAVLIPLLYHHA